VDGFLLLPATQLRVDTTKEFGHYDVVARGSKLYNRKDHTFVFTEPLKVEMVLLMEFEELPEAARNYISIKAARAFQTTMLGSQEVEAFTQDDELDALLILKSAEADTEDNNMFTGSYSVYSILER
jgi:hypothetical protein